MTVARTSYAAQASTTRGIFAGGRAPAYTDVIEYITIANTGNATDFGDLSAGRWMAEGNVTSATRGVFAGGYHSPGVYVNVIEYMTIASTGNATDFGDLTEARSYMAAGSNSIRGVFGGGYKNPGRLQML